MDIYTAESAIFVNWKILDNTYSKHSLWILGPNELASWKNTDKNLMKVHREIYEKFFEKLKQIILTPGSVNLHM